ncbi:hypothetical protein ACIRSJ_12255 [Streptomyces virginiae]|uniref:hypothetical protein n=1 Tax=Streptomyces virginiae TaxID=1961 RepID=UPI0038216BBA
MEFDAVLVSSEHHHVVVTAVGVGVPGWYSSSPMSTGPTRTGPREQAARNLSDASAGVPPSLRSQLQPNSAIAASRPTSGCQP